MKIQKFGEGWFLVVDLGMRCLPKTIHLLFLLFLVAGKGFSQEGRRPVVLLNNGSSLASGRCAKLSNELTAGKVTDEEKVAAIFQWITANIGYRTNAFRLVRKHSKRQIDEESTDTADLKPLDERVAETVLENGVAVCDGYARLFKTLCNFSGIQAEVVSGYARTDARKAIQRFRPNHSWNAVLIDSSWKLLDVTWASGYISWHGDDFVRRYDPQYYLTEPAAFISEHYPDDIRWTLMDNPPLMPEFRHTPYKQRNFAKYKIKSFFPERGIIDGSIGDTLNFELETADPRYDHQVSADPFLDTSVYNTGKAVLLVPQTAIDGRNHYEYVINGTEKEWIYLLYNDDLVLRYRLEVRRMPEPLVTGTITNN